MKTLPLWSCFLFVFASISYGFNPNRGCPDYPEKFHVDPTQLDTVFKEIDEHLSNVVESNNLPGFIVTVVYDQTQLWTSGYGKANYFNDSSRAPNGDDLLRVASNSKVFTDLFMYYLRDKGILNLDDPVSKYLTNFTILSPYKTTRPITLRQLASHTSGLPREVPYPCSYSQFRTLYIILLYFEISLHQLKIKYIYYIRNVIILARTTRKHQLSDHCYFLHA